jgi:hypothetical protein
MSRRPVPPAGESYHTQHAPFGAFASFTVGLVDAPGGFGQSLGGPAKQNVYVGFRGASHAQWQFLPFLTPPRSKAADYTGEVVAHTPTDYHALRPADYERTLGWASDTWRADNARFGFSLLSPFDTVPDPVKLRPAAARFHLAPLVCGWIEYDNRAGTAPVELMFGIGDSTPSRHRRRNRPRVHRASAPAQTLSARPGFLRRRHHHHRTLRELCLHARFP